MLVCDSLKASSAPDQSEGEFRIAADSQRAREQRDAAVEALRKKYAPKLAALEDRGRRAQERIDREKSQLSQQKLQTAFSVGASVLGAMFGRKAMSATNVNRAASAARSASRIGRESGDVDRAGDNLEAVQQQRADLQQQFEADTAALERVIDAAARAAAHGAGEPAQVRHRGRRSRAGVDALAPGRGRLSGPGVCPTLVKPQ